MCSCIKTNKKEIQFCNKSCQWNMEAGYKASMEADSHVCLKWNNHQSTVVSVLETLLDSGTLVDCTVAAEGRCLKAHRVILSSCSPFFALVFSQHYEKHPIVVLKDVRFQELRAMVDYMYRGEVNISQDQLGALLKVAKSLQIKGLSDSGERSVGVDVEAGKSREVCTSVEQSDAAAEHSAKPRVVSQFPTEAEVVDLSDDSVSSADTHETFSRPTKEPNRSPVDCTLKATLGFSVRHDNKMGKSTTTAENQPSTVCGSSNDPRVSSATVSLAAAPLTSMTVSEPILQNNSIEVPANNTASIKCETPLLSKATVLIPPGERTTTTLTSPLQKPESLHETPVKRESDIMDTDNEFTGDISRDFNFSDVDCEVPQERQSPCEDMNFLSKELNIERVVNWTCDVYSGLPKSKRPCFSRCKICGKVYKYNRNLTKHLKYECGKEPQFHCLYCPARYTQNGTLRKHLEKYHQSYDNVK